MVVLFRSNNIFSSRVNKYVSFYKSQRINYHVFGWDRLGEYSDMENYSFYKHYCGYSVGGIKAVINHLRWIFFVFKRLCQTKEITTIHACDLNSSFPAALYKVFFNKKVILIFDVCDWFSDNFSMYRVLAFILRKMEKFTVNKADEIIICEPERIEQIPFNLNKKELILPNIPNINSDNIFTKKKTYSFDNEKLTIGYFGGFTEDRFLSELLKVAESGLINLNIAGFGNKHIENMCIKLNHIENVRYYGKLSMADGLQMLYNSDIVYAMYCKTNRNNIYAAPNKYYESMFLGKPIISTKGTILEKKIIANNIGYVIDEDISELVTLLKSLKRNDIEFKGRLARRLWENKFSCYVDNFFIQEYAHILK